MTLLRFPLALIALSILGGCSALTRSAFPDSLVGTYARKSNPLAAFRKIEKDGTGYVVKPIHDRYIWAGSPAKVLDDDDYLNILHHKPDGTVAGLASGGEVFLKTPAGWRDGTHTSSTGYVLIFGGGSYDLVRLP